VFGGPVTFQWTPVAGARGYHLQVSKSPTFSDQDIIDDQVTDSSAYTSTTWYGADSSLYWRVRADAESDADGRTVALTWSATGAFTQRLAAPTPVGNATQGSAVPTWAWSVVPGAESYDVEVTIPNGTSSLATTRMFSGVPTNAFTPIEMKGTGIWKWRVRANFPKPSGNPADGPFSPMQTFIRTIPEPSGPTASVSGFSVVFSWNPRPARVYHVQVASTPDFAQLIEDTTTDNASYAPLLTQPQYAGGGLFYWRVAAADDISLNVGAYTAAQSFKLSGAAPTALKRFKLASRGYLIKNHRRRAIVIVKKAATGGAVRNAMVTAYGAGVTTTLRWTNRYGRATFYLRPTRLGRVTFRVSKVGFATAYLYKTVHAS
jgi:hypothetical protein